MSESAPIFADRILNVAVTGMLARIEFGALQPPRAEGQQPQLAPTQTVVMPLDGLLASMGMLDGLVRQLVKDGVIKPQAPPEAPQPADAAQTAA